MVVSNPPSILYLFTCSLSCSSFFLPSFRFPFRLPFTFQSDINEAPAIIVLCENEDDDEQKDIVAAVKAVATKQPKGSELLFFYGCSTGGIVERIRQLCKLDGNNKGDTFMIKIDIPDEGAFYVSKEKDINADSIEAFMKDSGNRQQLG